MINDAQIFQSAAKEELKFYPITESEHGSKVKSKWQTKRRYYWRRGLTS